ncbi:N-acetylmuramoyl-L-alanine amidase [Agathobaculum sp.]|uniref:N-acetylmuramoyl-L-alanine amidase n=1 Tax=Agathobaculum sp. TaxID=2048138 RepID=UPI003AF09035
MHFRRFAAVLCAVLGATLVGASAAAPKVAVSGHTFKVNGKNVAPQAYNIDGYNYFKLRDVAYLLADTTAPFNVTWSASQSTVVNIVPGQKYQKVGGELSASTLTSLKVSASTFKVLMEGKTLPLRGYLINGNNYYSIADIAESVGFEAGWDNATRTVSITTPDPDPEQPGNNGGSNGSDNTPTPTPKPTPAPTPTPVFTTGVYEVNVSSTLTVRSGPGTSYSSVGQLSKSDKVVVDSLSNGWAHLMDTAGGSGRYVSADYLKRLSDYDGSTTPDEPFTTGWYRVNVESKLAVRAAASTTGKKVGQLSNGAEIVVDSIANGWAHLMDTSNGTGRYVSANYLTRVRGYSASEGEPNDPVEPPRTSQIDGKMTVIIDPGHGGSDVGATSLDGTYDEKHINLTVAKYLQSYLKSAGVNVIMVRDTLEDGSDLTLRGAVMERYQDTADLFFSIHHNAANTAARGAEALAQVADKNGGPTKILAEKLLEEYRALGVPIRSIVFREGHNGDYYYTNRAAASLFIPALTSEFCFIDNAQDQKFIDSDEDLAAEARAQYNAIMYYFTQVEY